MNSWTRCTCAPPLPPHPHGETGGQPRPPRVHGKPPVMTWEQWAEFRQLEQAPTRVGVCFQNRYNPSVQLLQGGACLRQGRKGAGRPGFRHLASGGPYYTESGWRAACRPRAAAC